MSRESGMKVNEFSVRGTKGRRGSPSVRKASAPIAAPDAAASVLADADRHPEMVARRPLVVDEEQHNIYGATSEPGHEMHRIRKTNPTLWQKIKNWD